MFKSENAHDLAKKIYKCIELQINKSNGSEYIQNRFFPIGKRFTLTKGQFPIQEGYDYKNSEYELNEQPVQLYHINHMCKEGEDFYESDLPDEYGEITPCEITVIPKLILYDQHIGAGRSRKKRSKRTTRKRSSKRRKNTRRYNR